MELQKCWTRIIRKTWKYIVYFQYIRGIEDHLTVCFFPCLDIIIFMSFWQYEEGLRQVCSWFKNVTELKWNKTTLVKI